jgi:hypothetical protein
MDRGPEAQWLHAGDWKVLASPGFRRPPDGETFLVFAGETGVELRAVQAGEGQVFVPFDLDEAYRNYVSETWCRRIEQQKLSDRQLRGYYRVKRLLPRSFWLAARRAYIRAGKRPAFPQWPLDVSVERLLRLYAHCLLLQAGAREAGFAWFWPSDYRAAVILTHDVESADGLRLALDLADLEQARGLRSSFNIVGAHYPIDYGIVAELRGRGFEIGLHGLVHDRSLFSSRAEFERQLPRLRDAAASLGTVGFRSPATYRVTGWLPELPAEYDTSVPLSDPYEPQPGGCCSFWPFMLGELVELPYTLPQDHTLFTLLGEKTAATWLAQIEALEQRFGLIQIVSHPDRGYLGDDGKRLLYAETLDVVAANERLWKPLPRDLAGWWRRRGSGEARFPEQRDGTYVRSVDCPFATFVPPSGDAAIRD